MAEFIDLSGLTKGGGGGLPPILLERAVEAGAEIIRDEIKLVINESSPRGKVYALPGTQPPRKVDGDWIAGKSYRASAPGQPPAEREGIYRASWKSTPAVRDGNTYRAGVYNTRRVGDDIPLWVILEYGTTPIVGGLSVTMEIEPRPHIRPAIERALPKIRAMLDRLGA